MKKLLLIMNPYAGVRKANRFLPEMLRLFHDHDYRCEVYITGANGDATRFVAEYSEDPDLIICAGGDGTLNETLSGMLTAGLKCPVGYIPCGTTNDYASSIGLSPDVMEAAEDVMEGTPRSFDIGTLNGRPFVYTASCGAFAKVSYTTPQAAKNALGPMAYFLEGAKDVGNMKPTHMHIETEEYDLDGDFLFCSITNSTSVGGILKLDTQLVALNDGRFEVTLVRNPVNPAQLSTILHGLTTMDIPNEMIHFFSTEKLRIRCDEPVEWTLDGERGADTNTAELVNHHSAMKLIIPRHARYNPILQAEDGGNEL